MSSSPRSRRTPTSRCTSGCPTRTSSPGAVSDEWRARDQEDGAALARLRPAPDRSFTAGNDSPPTAIAAGALTLKHDAPVLIEHEGNRPVGRVRELFRMPWPDAVWHAAIVELDEDWPGSRGVSVGIVPLAETSLLDGHRIIERGVVDEISITSRPAVPGARLLPASETRAAETRAAPVAQPLVLRRPFGTVLRIR